MSDNSAYDWKHLEASAENPIWITSAEQLSEYCEKWRNLPLIALDTEFQRVDTFYPLPGLIQVADDQTCYLIDPLQISDFSSLSALFKDEGVVKVMHAATEDLELFHKEIGALPVPLFDTQIAAALINWGFSMGLQRMLESCLSVQLEKHETTSNWLQRPLTSSQEKYAALDVAYLPAIYEIQRQELLSRGHFHWVEQECSAMLADAAIDDVDGFSYYTRFTQMWRLPKHKLAALRDLTAWREQQARKRNVPRNRILRNQAILQIIEQWPKGLADLSRLDEIKKSILRTDGEVILGFLKGGEASADKVEPEPIPQPLHYFWNKHLKKLKAIARRLAEENNTAPEMLLRRKELEQLIRSGVDEGEYRLPQAMSAWRKEMLDAALMDELQRIEKLRVQGS